MSSTIWIGTFRNGKIYRLTRTSATEFAPELVADLDPTHMNLEGLAIDWRRGDTMYASTSRGAWRLGPDHLPLERIHPQSSTADIAISPCLADFLTDGFVDFFDYAEFVDAFEEGRMRVDLKRGRAPGLLRL